MLRQRQKAYSKENATCEWNDGGKIGNKKSLKHNKFHLLVKYFC